MHTVERPTEAIAHAALIALVAGVLSVTCHHPPVGPVASAVASVDTQAPPPVSVPVGAPDVPSLVARVRPVVVNITVEEIVKLPQFNFEWPFDFFQGPTDRREHAPAPQLRRQAQGSGFIIDSRGYVVTNAHVVEGAKLVRVRLSDDREFKARVKGRDSHLDLALLELESAPNLPVAVLGSAEAVRVGEYVVAMGNPFGLGHTVTLGIVSAKSRSIGVGPYDDFIQTDASINPGNSGGPLFNMQGEVIGINTAINPQGKGIGFAIPVDALREVLPQLLASGHVERGRIGAVIQSVSWPLAKTLGLASPRGALVATVETGAAADRAGLRSGDVIIAVDGVRIERMEELPRVIARHAPGTKVMITAIRDKREQRFNVTLDAVKGDEDTVTEPARHDGAGRYGLEVADAPGGGALLRQIAPGSSAAGELEPGDIVLEVNHAPIDSAKDLERALAGTPPFLLKVKHNGNTRFAALEGP